MAPRKIYIAGPIRLAPDYERKFTEAKERLQGLGWEVISPLDMMRAMGQTPGVPADDRAGMAADVVALVDCAAIFMLKGWPHSRGAKAELAVAVALDIPVYYQGVGWTPCV